MLNLPLFLRHARVDAYRGKVTLHQQLIQLRCPINTFDKNNNLIEVQCIKKVVQLPIFLHLAQFDVVLTFQRQILREGRKQYIHSYNNVNNNVPGQDHAMSALPHHLHIFPLAERNKRHSKSYFLKMKEMKEHVHPMNHDCGPTVLPPLAATSIFTKKCRRDNYTNTQKSESTLFFSVP